MKVKFTKASRLDNNTKVTVSLPQLTKNNVDVYVTKDMETIRPKDLFVGENFVLHVDGIPTVFTVNRTGNTAYTKSLPRHLPLPKVGKPVQAEVGSLGWTF